MMPSIIRCGRVYWKDTTANDPWCWTYDSAKAKVFEHDTAVKIVAYWERAHHQEIVLDDGRTIPSTFLGGFVPVADAPFPAGTLLSVFV